DAQTPAPAELEAWPNPTSDQIQVTGIQPGQKWHVVDATGRAVDQGLHAAGGLGLDVSRWESGIYLLRTPTSQIRFIVN
ncbi:MAG: Secretion system C-terminal sorting domain, partial [Bacteroidota bacterium]